MHARLVPWLLALAPPVPVDSPAVSPEPARATRPGPSLHAADRLCRAWGDEIGEDGGAPAAHAAAVEGLRNGCDQREPICCYNLAYAIENGVGIAREALESRALFEKACGMGVPEACVWLVHRARADHDDAAAVGWGRKACTPAARLGCNDLGVAMLDGRGTPVDEPESAHLFALGCDGGDATACLNYAGSLVHARGTAADYPQALTIYREYCEARNGEACEDEGELVRDGGPGVEADPHRAAELFLEACALSNANGCAWLGASFADDSLGEKSAEVAAAAYRRACELGQAHACNIAGLMAINGEGGAAEPAVGVALLESGCAAKGCRDESAPGCGTERRRSACHDLGWALVRGPGVSHDARRAFFLFSKLCAEGMAEGCEQVAVLEQDGEGVSRKDPEKAAALFDRACRGDDLNACNFLAIAYEEGKGVRKDPAHAAEMYGRLCERGFELGCSNLGELLRDGRGVKKDVARAKELFESACAHGEGYGCFNLGKLYTKGLGVGRDPTRGKTLRAKACKMAVPEACGS